MQYLLCPWDQAFIWSAEKWFEITMMVKWIILGDFYLHLLKSSDIMAEKKDSLHFTVNVPYGQQQHNLCDYWLVYLAQTGHHCQPPSVLVPSFWYFLTVCPVCEISSSQCSWLNCLFDLTSSEHSHSSGEFCDHLTSWINKVINR